MKSLFYAAAFVLGSIVSNAQLPGFEWARGIGGTNNDVGYSIAVDSYNNVITTGSFNGTVDFDPGPGIYNLSSGAGLGMYILKVDGSGNFIWAKSLAGLVISRCLTMDASGNIYTTGNFYGTVDFDPGTGSYNLNSNPLGSPDAFISKLDKNGDLLWAVKFGGYGVDGGVAIKTDATGNVYTVGNFERTTDFDPGIGVYNIVSGGEQDIFISKLDGSGNFIWARGFGGYRYDYGNAIALDETGNVYITGSFVDNVDFDPGPGNFAMYSSFNGAYVSKLDASGNFVWAKIVGGYTGNGISVDNDANVYTTGNFTGIVDFDPGPNTQYLKAFGDQDAFISKLDQAGNYVWARSFGGTATTSVSIALDAMANVYTIGRFNKIADFDPGPGVYFLSSSGILPMYNRSPII